MHFIYERIQKTCEELKGLEYKDSINIDKFLFTEGHYLTVEEVDSKAKWEEIDSEKIWGRRDYNCWFRAYVTVPKSFEGKPVVISVQTLEEGWDAINPQFIIFVNGKHIQGLDVNHRELILSNAAIAGETYQIDLHAYAGMSGTDQNYSTKIRAKLAILNEDVRGLYFDLLVPLLCSSKWNENSIERIETLTILNEAINLIDLRKIHSEEFYQSVDKARKFLHDKFYNMESKSDITVNVVGHTHIDVAWHWTVAQTRQKVGRSFSTVINLMKQYPEYIFMSSQPQLYQFVKEDYPELYEDIKLAIKEGKWDPEGAMWVEADCNVTSGESLVRQIIHGKKFFKDEFGVESQLLWLPDVFGYSAALPQIMKKSDINYFMTTKISWNQFNKIPCDTFMWKGIDGSEVLTHFITTTEPNQDDTKAFTTYNGTLHPSSVMGCFNRYQQKNINKEVLLAYGHGDGGGGVTYEMLEMGRRLEKDIKGTPTIKRSRTIDFFKKLENNVKDNPKLPKWVGELYMEGHRGTLTSMARNKKNNRKSELLYTELEKWNTISNIFGDEYPLQQLDSNWKTILLNQFHDILPGTSIKEVYDVTDVEYENVLKEGLDIKSKALNYVTSLINGEEGSLVVYNSLSLTRSDIVGVHCEKELAFVKDSNGNISHVQKVAEDKYIFYAKDIPSIGYKVYKLCYISEESRAEDNADKDNLITMNFEEQSSDGVNTRFIENKYFKVIFDEKGHITSIKDKVNNREVMPENSKANVIKAFEDKPIQYDNWDIDIFYDEKMWIVDDVASMKVVDLGPIRGTLLIERRFLDSTIKQYIHIYRDIPKVDFETFIDWKQSQILLKAEFPVDVNATKATYEIQYGNIERPTHRNTSWDLAKFEVCGQRWADLSDEGYGISILNDSKYGHDILGSIARITLLKSGTHPNPTTDQELHHFVYSLYPHEGTWRTADTEILAANLNTPLTSNIIGETNKTLPGDQYSFFSVNKDNIHIEVIKKSEDGLDTIIRMYESHNAGTTCSLKLFKDFESVMECNLIERDIKPLEINNKEISLKFKPFEIKTLRLITRV